MKFTCVFFFLLLATAGFAQDIKSNYREKKIAIADTVVLDSVSINPIKFSIVDKKGNALNSFSYKADFEKATVTFSEEIIQQTDSVTIKYTRYPTFLTKDYFVLDPKIIVNNTGKIEKLYSLDQSNKESNFKPFDGLNTVGSISRGITIGNNQNAVVNSALDLQITGKLNDKVNIRASLQDANIPTQEGGYSQSLDEFDQIFIELFSDNWRIRAGDVDLQQSNSYFGNFNKKVQGISLGGTINGADGSKTTATVAGALVRGVFAQSEFVGLEGNQGPYKLVGPNGELFILVVSGSERVYVNGLLLSRGENEDYVIDYNAGEIKFNSTYPITSNMRITVEYQYTDRSYTRFIGYGAGNYESEKLDLGVYVYSENDAKNQPLQQSLTEEQVAILQAAGDNPDLMTAPSAVPDTFSDNKILYKKENRDGVEIFVFSNNPDDALFNVRFSRVGPNNGNYVISGVGAINRIFEYVPPINGLKQGNYDPIVRLQAPTKLQVGGLNGSFHPSNKTKIDFEIAGSKNDLNLFSNLEDSNNDGFAGRVAVKQRILQTVDSLRLDGFGSLDFINKDFRTIERLYNIEFSRDWNLINPQGNQRFVIAGAEFSKPRLGAARYEFQNLDFSENYKGVRQVVSSILTPGKFRIFTNGSLLNSKSDTINTQFFRFNNNTVYSLKNAWAGGKINLENNKLKTVANDSLTPISQKFSQFEVYSGIGDSTKVFVEAGYQFRTTDSLRNGKLTKVNNANTFYIKSKPIDTENTQLSVFANYRIIDYKRLDSTQTPPFGAVQGNRVDEKSLNSRIIFNQTLLERGITWNTVLESNNGVIPQQEFTYIITEPGQGIYAWNDYNNNGIQELEEFELAQFQDQAEYIRVLLPNQIFLKIRQNKFSQIVTLNPQNWQNKEGILKTLSHFYNQTSYVIDRKVRRQNDGFNISPFKNGNEDELGLTLNFRNALFYNRGKQKYTTSYTYIATSSSNLLSLGLQESKLKSHQLNFNHKVAESWLLQLQSALGTNESISENFGSRNYNLDTYEINPKISYLLNQQTRFDVFYEYANKENILGEKEALSQQKIGTSLAYTNAEKISVNGEFNYIDNSFKGSAFSPVSYQILEGLQPGTNFTWRLLFQKRITKYLDANLTYNGRKSENTKAIHTGSLQLRAFF